MQVLYKFLITIEVILGFLIIALVILQKSASEGLVGRVSNPFNNSSDSAPPITKLTRILVLLFFVCSISLTSVKSRLDKPVSLLTEESAKKEKVSAPKD